MKKIVTLFLIILVTVMAFQAMPARAALNNCQFRGTNAQEYYNCTNNITQFTVSNKTFTQPNGQGCVWVSGGAGYHFTSAISGDYGDVHITYDADDRHCGADIVAPRRCYRSTQAEKNCTTQQADAAEAACNAFVIAGNCDG